MLDQTKTQPITLVAGENVYKAYFYRADGYVYYFVNTPQGAEAEGEMDFATVTYGAPHTVSESRFTVRGYRFAGWSDSPEGEVVYAAGDEISQVKGTIMLYARWNYGATDAGGGADRIYLLMESPLKAVLERPVLGEKRVLTTPTPACSSLKSRTGGRSKAECTRTAKASRISTAI